MSNKNKAVCLFSGGIDSTTLLYQLLNEKFQVYAIGFNYGQRHNHELKFGENTCKKLDVPYKIINLPFFGELAPSALTRSCKDNSKTDCLEDLTEQIVVPNRNMVFLSLATSYAISLNINKIFYGAHLGDKEVFPDCRKEFVEAMRNSVRLCHYERIELYAPFLDLNKSEIIQLGLKLGVDYSDTWSCYNGKKTVCGNCLACNERTEAFMELGITDPLK